MPVKYEIGNIYDIGTPCDYCGSSGVQHIGSLGYRACQYCITGYKVRHCESCSGRGCPSCLGTKHEFYNELSAASPSYAVPDTVNRHFAGEVAPRPPTTIFRR